MATFSYTNLFTAGTPAVASQVNTNFNDVRTFAQGISTGTNIDASAISEAKIANNAVSYPKLGASVLPFLAPVGSITMYTGVTAPAGWLLCDGVTSTAGYTALAELVGATTPNLQGRFPIGDNSTLALKGTGGSLKITEPNLPYHVHSINHDHPAFDTTGGEGSHGHAYNVAVIGSNPLLNASDTSVNYAFDTTSNTTEPAGAHNHSINPPNFTGNSGGGSGSGTDYYPPYYVVNFIIKHD
jgi:microcystin-dependent protein